MYSKMLIVLGIFLASESYSASFNCGIKNLSKVEEHICADSELSFLDNTLSTLYKQIRKNTGEAEVFGFLSDKDIVGTQRIWLRKRNRCKDFNCIKGLYYVRLAEVTKLSEEQLKYRSEAYLFNLLEGEIPLTIYRDNILVEFYRYHYSDEDKTIYVVVSGGGEGVFHYKNRKGWCGGDPDYFMSYIEIAEDNSIKKIESLVGNSCENGIIPKFRTHDIDKFSMGHAHDHGFSEEFDEFLKIRIDGSNPSVVQRFTLP